MTPKMSSYLIAFIVSDLVNTNVSQVDSAVPTVEPVSSADLNLPVINIWTRKDAVNMTKYEIRLPCSSPPI